MPTIPIDEDDYEFTDDIERFWIDLDHTDIDYSRTDVLPGSDFASDEAALAYPQISRECLELISCALDHIRCQREYSGNEPHGYRRWRMKAPWTLLRAALELASQAIWLAAPDSQNTRIERLLQLEHDNIEQSNKAKLALMRERDRHRAPFVKASKDWFDQVAGPWETDRQAANRMRNDINMTECIEEAAKASGITRPIVAINYWRIASGYAHGRHWVTQYTASLRDLDVEHGPTQGLKIDYRQVALVIVMVINSIRYAIHLVKLRSGYESTYQPIADITVGQYDVTPPKS